MNENVFLENIRNIYEMFEDKLSKELYISRLNWLMTGDYQYVEQIVRKSHSNIPIWNRKEEKEFLKELPDDKNIIFYGAGSFAKRLLPYLYEINENTMFCDRDVQKQNTGFHGFKVISPEMLFRMKDKKVVICTTKYYQDTENILIAHGVAREDILDIREFFICGTGDDYFYEDFLQYNEEEIFIDAGCCDLGTTIDFARLCTGLKKVYAFEPDLQNYKDCVRRIEEQKDNLPEIVMLPYGTWSEKTELHFEATADGCSHIGEGDTIIRTAAIDDIIANTDKVTFIKMDVEGAELESLKGAERVIKKDRPKLAICIYHKPEDMITLPMYIKSLVPEYRFYLRSYSNSYNEIVLYAVL